jgi:hypothetical protein
MVIVWSGTGMFLILFFCLAHFLCNVPLYLDYSKEKFELMNWTLPLVLSGGFAWVLGAYSEKMNHNATEHTYIGRLFLYLGDKHHVFWIPVRYWSFILLSLAAWVWIRTT